MSKYSLFGEALTDALTSSGLNASSLAEKVEVHRSRISDFAAGGSLPKDDTLKSMCEALPQDHAANVAKAWVRERLGSALSDMILSSDKQGSTIEKLFASLPSTAAKAFRGLMEVSREDADLRQSIVSLHAFSQPGPADPGAPQKIIYTAQAEGLGTRHSFLNEEATDDTTALIKEAENALGKPSGKR